MHNGRSTEYRPGFIAFSPGFGDKVFRSLNTNADIVTDTGKSMSTTEEEVDKRWRELEELRREHQKRIQDEGLQAELEYARLRGRLVEAEVTRESNDSPGSMCTDETRILMEAWEEYDKAWDRLSLSVKPMKKFIFRKIVFTFDDIPWPILKQYRLISSDTALGQIQSNSNHSLSRILVNDLNATTIAQFLLHPVRDPSKTRKEKLRDAILHYHPDKFHRFMYRVVDSDRAYTMDCIDAVIRALNELVNAEV